MTIGKPEYRVEYRVAWMGREWRIASRHRTLDKASRELKAKRKAWPRSSYKYRLVKAWELR